MHTAEKAAQGNSRVLRFIRLQQVRVSTSRGSPVLEMSKSRAGRITAPLVVCHIAPLARRESVRVAALSMKPAPTAGLNPPRNSSTRIVDRARV